MNAQAIADVIADSAYEYHIPLTDRDVKLLSGALSAAGYKLEAESD